MKAFLASIGVLLFALCTGLWFQNWTESPVENPALILTIEPGSPSSAVARQLQDAGVTNSAMLFRILLKIQGRETALKAGEYAFPASMAPLELAEMVVLGRVKQYPITLREGITIRELLADLQAYPALSQAQPELNPEALQEVLGLELPFAEGAFLPDTYFVEKGTSIRQLLGRAHAELLAFLEVAWSERQSDIAISSPQEALILASLIEKESGLAEDRAQISQVFHERLRRNMRLQTDPTVIFALGAQFDGDLRRRDLKVDSPFNTYRVKGLTPTPIALPSKAAIMASVKPAAGAFLYFVARGDGSSQFSRTLEEHNEAVYRYQLQRNTP